MSKRNIGRSVLAVVAGYLANGILVAITEPLLRVRAPGAEAAQPLRYFVLDLMSQCLYTVAAGYLCSVIAGPTRRGALAGLMGLGVLVGTVSLVLSWKTEPPWYGIALLAVYAPCVWIGGALKSRCRTERSSPGPRA